jgi:hypothetical protein
VEQPGALRLAGRVESGVEAGSVVLHDDGGSAWQLGRAWAHLAGRRVVVRGRPRPDLLTTAQQGTPLAVESVESADGEPLAPLPPGTRRGRGRGPAS